MAIIQPSYNQGFARYKGESQFPNLWDEFVACYDMGLGPTGGTLFDHAGRRLDGTLTNMDPSTDWVGTEHGWALDFDGSNDFVSITPRTISAELSLAGWCKWSGGSGTRRTLIGDVNAAGGQYHFSFEIQTTNVLYFQQGTSPNFVTVSANTALVQSQWYHVAVVRTGSSGNWTFTFYLNGRSDGAPTGTHDPSASNALSVGRPGALGLRYWFGQIGTKCLWSRALTPAEIQQLYLGSSPLTLRRRKRFFVSSDDALNLTATPAIFDWVSKDATLTLGPVNLPTDPAVVTWVSKDAGITVGTANLSTDAAVVTWVAKDSVAVPDSVTISTTPAVVQWEALDATIPGPAQLDAEVAIFEWIATDATATIFVPPNPPSSGLSANQCATRARASRAGGGTQATRIMPCSPSLARRSS